MSTFGSKNNNSSTSSVTLTWGNRGFKNEVINSKTIKQIAEQALGDNFPTTFDEANKRKMKNWSYTKVYLAYVLVTESVEWGSAEHAIALSNIGNFLQTAMVAKVKGAKYQFDKIAVLRNGNIVPKDIRLKGRKQRLEKIPTSFGVDLGGDISEPETKVDTEEPTQQGGRKAPKMPIGDFGSMGDDVEEEDSLDTEEYSEEESGGEAGHKSKLADLAPEQIAALVTGLSVQERLELLQA